MSETKTRPEDLKLITREEVNTILDKTENLTFVDLLPGGLGAQFFGADKEHLSVNLGGTELSVHPQALKDSAHCIGMLSKYVERCPTRLLLADLNYFLGEGMDVPLRSVVQGNTLISMTRDRVKTSVVSNQRLLSLAERKIGLDHIIGYHQVSTDLEHTSMSIVTDKHFEPAHDDTLFGGIKIRNSILGRTTIEASPYVFRQWCSNGSITAESLGKYTRKKHDILDDWVNEIIESSDNRLDREFGRIKHLTEISVKGHIMDTILGLGKDYKISAKILEEAIDEAHIDPIAETMYDIYNIFTRIASHREGLTPMNINKLQKVAGGIAKRNELCGTCHRVIR